MTKFDLTGPPDAPALVLLHAAAYTRQMWIPQMEALGGEFRILAPDLPGHGSRAGEAFTFDAARATVLTAMDDAGITRAVLAGVSLGGVLAMQLGRYAPERVAGLALSGATFDARGPLCRLILTGEGFVFPRGAARFTRAYQESLRRRYPAPTAEAMSAPGLFWDAAAKAVLAMRGLHFRADLEAFPGPTLILNGRRDWVHRTSEWAYARSARHVTIRPIPGAGHLTNVDRPAEFSQALREFTRRCWEETTPVSLRTGEG